LEAIDYRSEVSMGLFDGKDLVGFLLVGRRGSAAYDGGTAIIPSHRARGLSHLLIDATLAHLKDRGCTTFTLEVLFTNTRAKALYHAHGFVEERTFCCYRAPRLSLVSHPSTIVAKYENTPFMATNRYKPSWQNETRSIAQGGYAHASVLRSSSFLGSIAFHPERGSIAQIVLNDDDRDISTTKEVIITCARMMEATEVRIINVDERDTVVSSSLEGLGFERFALQREMVRLL
jgi:hypothetical protein